MKYEIGTEIPKNFTSSWPGQYQMFSHYEYACGIPHLLFAITTYKENGLPNICLHSWSCFQGDEGGYFAILTGLGKYSHTLANIKRTGEFGINFLSREYYDGLQKTIAMNNEEVDEFEIGGFTHKKASFINAPLIEESFLALECKSENILDLSNAGITAMVIGKVVNAIVDEEYGMGIDKKYSDKGFFFNLHAPKIFATGEDGQSGIASLRVDQLG